MKEHDFKVVTSTQKTKHLGYHCPICCEPSHLKVHRNWFLKYVLFFLPVRKYFCAGCRRQFYINIHTAQKATVYVMMQPTAA